MTLDALINKATTSIVERSNTLAEEVGYHPKGKAAERIKVIPEYGEFEKDGKDEIASRVVFHLSQRKPKYGDAVVHNGTRYIVLGFKQVGDKYDIITEIRQHKSGRR